MGHCSRGNRGPTMTYGRGGGRNDRGVRGPVNGRRILASNRDGHTDPPTPALHFAPRLGSECTSIKVLLFAATPRGTAPLDLPREFREIDEEVRRGAFIATRWSWILVPGTRPAGYLLRKLQ